MHLENFVVEVPNLFWFNYTVKCTCIVFCCFSYFHDCISNVDQFIRNIKPFSSFDKKLSHNVHNPYYNKYTVEYNTGPSQLVLSVFDDHVDEDRKSEDVHTTWSWTNVPIKEMKIIKVYMKNTYLESQEPHYRGTVVAEGGRSFLKKYKVGLAIKYWVGRKMGGLYKYLNQLKWVNYCELWKWTFLSSEYCST